MPTLLDLLPLDGETDLIHTLSLSKQQLSGEIPQEISNFINLEHIYCGDNQLSGEIPRELSSLTKLHTLLLAKNQLSGKIPVELSSLTMLQVLSLYKNQLSGEIPVELSSLSRLSVLSLLGNQLTGTIPQEFSSLSDLRTLQLWGNQLSGVIPLGLSSLINLQNLSLANNQLSGEIPSQLSCLINLQKLSLTNNRLSGTIPPALSSLTNLSSLNLGHNQLTGEIPLSLSSLSKLQNFNTFKNQLSGEIPSKLSTLTNLQSLMLWGNKLSGRIPSTLSSITNLEKLSLGGNKLSGMIPPELSSLTKLRLLYLNNNQLSGIIPQDQKITSFNLSKNYFDICEPVPEKWVVKNAFQPLPELKHFSEMGLPNRVVEFYCNERKPFPIPNDAASILNCFHTGEYPVGLPDNLLWGKTLCALQRVPEEMKEETSRLKILDEQQNGIEDRLAEIEREKRILLKKLNTTKQQRNEIEKKLQLTEEIINSNFEQFAQSIFKAEEEAVTAMKQQFDKAPEDFGQLLGDKQFETSAKLSLVFNAFGMSSTSILQLSQLCGYEFMDSNIKELCEEVNITSFTERKLLGYIQNMMKDHIFYGAKHQEKCPICSAETAKDLVYLVEEHAISNDCMKSLDLNILIQNNINGRAFLALNTQDIKQVLATPEDKCRMFSQTKRYFEALHHNSEL